MLGPDPRGELPSHAPGPVADEEVVHIGLGPDGEVESVVVEQTLTISGVGDFELRVLAPVEEVDAPPEQSPQPGLRRNTVLWSGFSPGIKVLRSSLTLEDAAAEAARLPLAVDMRDGVVVLRNQTTAAAAVDVGPTDVGSVVASARARLAAGENPLDGLPRTIPATGPVTEERVAVTVPVRVLGHIGATPVDAVVGEEPHTVVATGDVRLSVTAVLPSPDALSPAAGVRELQAVLTAAVRKADFEAFVGVTVPGPSSTVYEYAPAAAPPPPPPPAEETEADPLAIALAVVGALAIAVVGRALWLRS